MKIFKQCLKAALLVTALSMAPRAEASPAITQKKNSVVVVAGQIQRSTPAHRMMGDHVHVALLDTQGREIASRNDRLPPTAPKRDVSRNYRASYSVAFDADTAAKAAKIRVLYVNRSHGVCGNT